MYICLCHEVTKKEILDAIEKGFNTCEKIGVYCKAGTDCGSCLIEIKEIIDGSGALLDVKDKA